MSVAATVRRLQSRAKLVRQLVLIANPTNEPHSTYLDALATAAHRAADSLLCSSILAGHASESDDFADMAVWLGNDRSYGKGNEQSVLAALQLGLETGTITSVPLATPSNIPTTVRVKASTPELETFTQKLAELDELHCFSMRPPSGSDVVYSLIGKSAAGWWGGLVGLGTWSDD